MLGANLTGSISGGNAANLSGQRKAPQFGEVSKLLPVVLALASTAFLYTVFLLSHVLRLLQLDLPPKYQDHGEVSRGKAHFVVLHALTGLVLYCMARSILTVPGFVPEGAPWDLRVMMDKHAEVEDRCERKRDGARRHCKWCLIYKPDRCHHCRVCNTCVLRMDHHCCFLYNCIGFHNYKYFFLLLVYTVSDLIFIVFTLPESGLWAMRVNVDTGVLLTLALAETYAVILLVVVGVFFGFHCSLVLRGMTTLEHCEKSNKKPSSVQSWGHSVYENICAILGPRPLLWLLPFSFPAGDGITFKPTGAPLSKDSSSPRQRSERKTQHVDQH